MKSIFVFFTLLLSATFLFADEDLESHARAYWDNMPDHTNPVLLDECISQYPETETGRLAFLLRYFLLTQNPTIEGYNEFLAKYPERFQSQYALQELFELCARTNKVKVWADFLGRYPGTLQGVAAKLHLQTLFANYALLSEDEATLDEFIMMFPDAPQIPGIIDLAAKIARKHEEETKAGILKKYEGNYDQCEREIEKRANRIVNSWLKWHTELYELDEAAKKAGEDVMMNGQAVMLMAQIRRYEVIIYSQYDEYASTIQIREEKRHKELLNKLDSIQKTLLDNHRELVHVIREESEKTRATLREEFAKLGYKIDAGFEALNQKMDVLHNDLVSVYSELQKVNRNLENIHESIQKGNEILANIDAGLHAVNEQLNVLNENLVQMDQHMNQQFDRLVSEVSDFKEQTVARLDVVIENQDRSFDLQCKQYEVALQTLSLTEDIRDDQQTIIQQNNTLIDLSGQQLESLGRIEENQGRQLNELANLREDVGNGFRSMSRQMAAGFRRVEGAIYSVGDTLHNDIRRLDRHMIQGFAETNRNIQQTGKAIVDSNMRTWANLQRAQQQPRRSSGQRVRSFFGRVLTVAGGIFGTCFGGPAGTAIGTAVGRAVGKAVEGGNRREIAQSAIEGGFSSVGTPVNYPSSGQIFDAMLEEGKNVVKAEARERLENEFSPRCVRVIDSMVVTNLQIEKQKSIQMLAALDCRLGRDDVQRINQCQSLREVRSTVEEIARKNGKKPAAVRYAIQYL